MLLAIECMIACIIFALIILPTQYKNPIKYIMSYPPEIRKRVRNLKQHFPMCLSYSLPSISLM